MANHDICEMNLKGPRVPPHPQKPELFPADNGLEGASKYKISYIPLVPSNSPPRLIHQKNICCFSKKKSKDINLGKNDAT